jgi:autotransporter-associated beta strand protein
VDSIAGGTPVLTVGDNDQTSSFDGVIQNTAGTLALTKVGTGTLTLNGTNTYTGDTTVSGGELAVTGSSINDTEHPRHRRRQGRSGRGNETVAALFFGATPMADGVYGSTSSTAPLANQDNTRFSGTGTVTVDSSLVPGGFSTWLANGGFANDALLVGQDGPNDDPDNDGISNLVEYALDGFDPTAPNAAPGSISGLLVTYTKRALAVTNGDVTYTIEESTDLGVSDLWAPAAPTTNDDFVITYTLTPPAPSENFVRLRVAQP